MGRPLGGHANLTLMTELYGEKDNYGPKLRFLQIKICFGVANGSRKLHHSCRVHPKFTQNLKLN